MAGRDPAVALCVDFGSTFTKALLVDLATGGDQGGSIRIPAAICGLVGLKPSRGRVEASKETRDAPIDLVSNGIVSRSVRDTAR